jgi:predicted nucleic acid-binding protein
VTAVSRPLRGCARFSKTSLDDFEAAAELYRRCRRGGETVRTLMDCLVAAVALRTGAAVLHQDRDYDAIARHAPLQIAGADGR